MGGLGGGTKPASNQSLPEPAGVLTNSVRGGVERGRGRGLRGPIDAVPGGPVPRFSPRSVLGVPGASRTGAMWIQVRTMDGKETHRVDSLSKLTKVEGLRLRIHEVFGVEPHRQRLFYRGKQVPSDSPKPTAGGGREGGPQPLSSPPPTSPPSGSEIFIYLALIARKRVLCCPLALARCGAPLPGSRFIRSEGVFLLFHRSRSFSALTPVLRCVCKHSASSGSCLVS